MALSDIFYTADRLYIAITMIVIIVAIVAFYKKHFRAK